jgi:hypothetical protein
LSPINIYVFSVHAYHVDTELALDVFGTCTVDRTDEEMGQQQQVGYQNVPENYIHY